MVDPADLPPLYVVTARGRKVLRPIAKQAARWGVAPPWRGVDAAEIARRGYAILDYLELERRNK